MSRANPTGRCGSVLLILCLVASFITSRRSMGADLDPWLKVPVLRSENGILRVDLEAKFVKEQNFDLTGTKGSVKLNMPTYNGNFLGPVLRLKKGDELRINLTNSLTVANLPEPTKRKPGPNYPHGFSTTNLHTHGLHVSPSGAADNTFLEVAPGVPTQKYRYQLLPNHPAGTFWYHPHKHGSSAQQATGGMSGALIVEGDLDDIPAIKKAYDRIFVLQQMHVCLDPETKIGKIYPADIYDKMNEAGQQQCPWADQPAPTVYSTNRETRANSRLMQRAKLKDADVTNPDDPDLNSPWALVNGQLLPCFSIFAEGTVERWRFIHAGAEEGINVALVSATDSTQQLPLYEIAVDGLPRGRMIPRLKNPMYPAYRWDVMFQAPPAGEYYVIDAGLAAGLALSATKTNPKYLAKMTVEANPPVTMALPTDAELARAVPAEFSSPITDQEVGNRRWDLQFDFPEDAPDRFLINGREFEERRIDRVVRLGTAEEWILGSKTGTKNNAGHPFHAHVNPFEQLVYGDLVGTTVLTENLQDASYTTNNSRLVDLVFSDPTLKPFHAGQVLWLKVTSWDGLPLTPFSVTIKNTMTLRDLAEAVSTGLNGLAPPPDAKKYRVRFDEQTRKLVIIVEPLEQETNKFAICCYSDRALTQMDTRLAFSTQSGMIIDRIWRDTVMAPAGNLVTMRTRFRDWTGKTVLHCHILDHEEQGMMKNICILGPDDPDSRCYEFDSPPAAHGTKAASTKAEAAPAFALPDISGKSHDLSEFAGRRVILVFYRGYGCLHCAQQLQAFGEIQDRLKSAKVILIAVSTESQKELREAVDSLKPAALPFLFLADEKHEVFRRYGCFDKQPMHGTFVIDPQGQMTWASAGSEEPFMDVELVLSQATRSEITKK